MTAQQPGTNRIGPTAEDLPEHVLTVMSDRTFDGVYIPTILFNDQLLLTLDRERAFRYVGAWAEAIARAEFDAAVYAQLVGIGVDEQAAVATVVYDLRPDRPPLDVEATAPLRLEPILSQRTKRGQVAAYHGDRHLLQLDAPSVYDHIAKVLPVVMTCDLDAAYRRYAIGSLQQPESRADAMVADLARWRAAEVGGAERDRWVDEQFANITGTGAQRPPWQANGRAGKRHNKKKR